MVTDIVTSDYRTASVFRKYNIDFCCGAKIPLETACTMRGLSVETVKSDLENAIRTISVSTSLRFDEWKLDFMADYIVRMHHDYLKTALPETMEFLKRFADGHRKKYGYLTELENVFLDLIQEMLPHLTQEEEILFPYIRQIAHAYYNNEPYAGLLVRTLSKPVADVMKHEHETVSRVLNRMRELTGNYAAPQNACTSHKVAFLKLLEIDNDLVQHMHLENNILFPKAIAMEKEMLQRK